MTMIDETQCMVIPCSRPATVDTIAGCRHEHEIRGRVCDFHFAAEVNPLRLSCRQCWRASADEHHICAIRFLSAVSS